MPDRHRALAFLIAIGSAGALRAPLRATRRRAVLAAGVAAVGTMPPLLSANALDVETKDLGTTVSSKLLAAPAESTDALGNIDWGAPKVTGLSTEEMANRIDAGLRRECWFVTGRSLPELFSNSFKFSDPQVRHQHDHHITAVAVPQLDWCLHAFYRCR